MASNRGKRAAVRLAALLTTTGTLHFAAPRPFDSVIPPAIPGPPRFWTYASGVAELGVAGLLAVPRTRRLGGSLAAALFVAVFPANIWAVRLFWRKPLLRAVMLARLPLQVPLVTEALRARE
ncbi:DoxX family protein [Actinophytocola algeriensis]|uniref:Putative membrane protein n=1 Tax=Actinophytocola algeriensis TaxID=1768010 RepID=A0A7W7PZL5_9PSEU|nr:hypothetical protein [Actinophytocola algeriensis]MBB4904174.1 putative membrane protein [Actinophytocola algeriensis]MBE1476969.1 putative membrane protein [Actinophytocola algeriensis]